MKDWHLFFPLFSIYTQWRSWLRVRRSRSHSMADGECASFTFPRLTTDHLFTSSRWWYYSVRRGFLFQENHDLYSIDVLMMCNQRLKFVPRLRERFEGLIMRLRERILPITWTRKHSCEIMIQIGHLLSKLRQSLGQLLLNSSQAGGTFDYIWISCACNSYLQKTRTYR